MQGRKNILFSIFYSSNLRHCLKKTVNCGKIEKKMRPAETIPGMGEEEGR
jgi:hypothetical protein